MGKRHDAVLDDVLSGLDPVPARRRGEPAPAPLTAPEIPAPEAPSPARPSPEAPALSPLDALLEARGPDAPPPAIAGIARVGVTRVGDHGANPPERDRAGSRFLKRSSGLSDRLSGEVVEQTLRWIDPARCRMWARHNRRYDLLSEQRCADLIEGFKAQGRQEFPAIVRRIEGDPEHDFEVICGARRHWVVSWLRAHNFPDFKFLIEERALTDEAAFRLGDIENREREDISDYERALDYADALARYYPGGQKEMAGRLEVSESWLSRYLMLAKLPKAIIEAYASITDIREHHARDLRPLLADPVRKRAVLDAAKEIARAQKDSPLDGPAVLARLKAAVRPPKKAAGILGEVRSVEGRVLVAARRKGRGLVLEVAAGAELEAVLAACGNLLKAHL